mmetsp:Transcript_22255/g.38204  ORF Transcript_22255/g.38204 Transcript_22255/m.38204 type:complete len:361 (+) Transcript_22255:103-1185(+)
MKYAKLGSSDLNVSNVCLGTMTWGKQNTEEDAHAQLDLALSLGVNFIDTAEVYPAPPASETCGLTEKYIGTWLEKRGCRDKIVLATKVAGPGRDWINANRSDPPNPSAPAARLTADQIPAACDASLRRLKTTYIDLYQLHWPDRYVPLWGESRYMPERERPSVSFDESVRAMGELIKAGKVRHWGLSNETTYGVCMMCDAAKRLGVPLPVSIQNDHSLVYRPFESELAEACAPSHFNIGLLAYGPLAGGSLSGKYLNGASNPKARHTLFPTFQPRYHAARTMAACAKYAELAKEKGMSPTELALRWMKSPRCWYVTSSIIGATTLEQLKENILAFDGELDGDTLDKIDEVHRQHRNPNMD